MTKETQHIIDAWSRARHPCGYFKILQACLIAGVVWSVVISAAVVIWAGVRVALIGFGCE